MATLQKLRNKGSLLIAFVGIALFAFVAGDIVKLFQKTPEEPAIGVINGEEIKVSEFYNFRSQCEQAFELRNGQTTEADQEVITQMAWSTIARHKTLKAQAEKAGIEVTEEEISLAINNPNNYLGADYRAALSALNQAAYYNPESITSLELALRFLQTELECNLIENKLNMLYSIGTMVPNKALAQSNFDLNNNTYKVEIASYPYSSYPNDKVEVTDAEITEFYNANKADFEMPADSYGITYINSEILPTEKDRAPLLAELENYAAALTAEDANVAETMIFSSSDCEYDGFLWTIDAAIGVDANQNEINKFKEKHVFHIQQNEVGVVSKPFENNADNTYNVVMNVRKQMIPDSIKFRAIIVQSNVAEEVTATTDSLLNALKNKADFNEIAKNYAADTVEFKTRDFAAFAGIIPTPEAQKDLYTAKVGEYKSFEFNPNATLVYQVMEKKGEVEAYDPAIIERRIPISTATYNAAYNKLSNVITASNNAAEYAQNARANGYYAANSNVNSYSMNINNLPGSRELLRWVVDGRKVDEKSNIFEYSLGNKKYLIAAIVNNVTPKGYIPLEQMKSAISSQLTFKKKGDLIAAEMKGKSFEQLKENSNIKFDTTENVDYKKATSVQSLNRDELVISAAVAKMNEGETSAPLKGNNAVYIVKVIAKTAKEGTAFNSDEEANHIQMNDLMGNPQTASQMIQQVMNDTYDVENVIYQHM